MSEPIETFPSAALGFRSWELTLAGHLRSTGDGQMTWRPGVNVAYCSRGSDHHAPASDCSCGLYALHSPDPEFSWNGDVIGALACKGEAEVHHDGFRCQEAQLLGLWAPPSAAPVAAVAADHYGVPLFEDLGELELHGERFASSVPEEIRPQQPLRPRAEPRPATAPRRSGPSYTMSALFVSVIGFLVLAWIACLVISIVSAFQLDSGDWSNMVWLGSGLLCAAIAGVLSFRWAKAVGRYAVQGRATTLCILLGGVSFILMFGVHAASRSKTPVNEEPPAIQGVVSIGQVVEANPGKWNIADKGGITPGEDDQLTYQWLRCQDLCQPIQGATLSNYKVSSADAAASLAVKVTVDGRSAESELVQVQQRATG